MKILFEIRDLEVRRANHASEASHIEANGNMIFALRRQKKARNSYYVANSGFDDSHYEAELSRAIAMLTEKAMISLEPTVAHKSLKSVQFSEEVESYESDYSSEEVASSWYTVSLLGFSAPRSASNCQSLQHPTLTDLLHRYVFPREMKYI